MRSLSDLLAELEDAMDRSNRLGIRFYQVNADKRDALREFDITTRAKPKLAERAHAT